MSDVVELTASGLSKDFGDGGVLRDVDLTIEPGETTVLLGPNGSGKSVLLACLAGGLHPDEGTVRIDGESPGAAADRLSMLQQDALAIPNLSGREAAQFYADLHPRANGEWAAVADRLDLEDLDRRIRDYSGGMRRKLEIAVTLGPDVPIYLLDEPTAELDMTTVDALRSVLRERAEAGKTVVLASHLPGDARAADRIVVVVDGEVVADGTPEELLGAVPRVVRLADTGLPDEAVREHLLDGRVFERGEVVVGFLAPSAAPEDVGAALGDEAGERYEVVDPSHPDLFNYHVHLDGQE